MYVQVVSPISGLKMQGTVKWRGLKSQGPPHSVIMDNFHMIHIQGDIIDTGSNSELPLCIYCHWKIHIHPLCITSKGEIDIVDRIPERYLEAGSSCICCTSTCTCMRSMVWNWQSRHDIICLKITQTSSQRCSGNCKRKICIYIFTVQNWSIYGPSSALRRPSTLSVQW